MRHNFIKASISTVLVFATCTAAAQDDSTPIRLLVGYAPGGAIDTVGRAVADKLRETLRQPVVVENKAGANQRLAVAEVKRSRPDGLTLVIANNAPFTLFPHLYKKLDFDPVKDFTPVGQVATYELCLSAGPKAPQGDIRDLISWAKKNPSEAAFATSGPGNMSQFVGLMLSNAAGVNFNHVAYKGGSPALVDVAGGQVPISIDTCLEPMQMSRGGKVRILATTGTQRNALLPKVPTLREAGVDVEAEGYVGIYAPANMPADKVERLSKALNEALKSPEVLQRITQAAMTPAYGNAAALAAAQEAGLAKWRDPIKASGLVMD